jgi:hypothetical protein
MSSISADQTLPGRLNAGGVFLLLGVQFAEILMVEDFGETP